MNTIQNDSNTTKTKRALNRFPTIGYLVTDTVDAYNDELHAALSEAAQQHGANLISFLGGHFRNSPYDHFNYQRNAAYDLISTNNVDGLIINSIVGNYVSREELKGFYSRYSSLPLVNIGKEMPGIASILVDNEKGLREAMVHLIERHGCRHIAFIRGPEANFEAEIRYHAYTAVLAEYGLPLDDRLVAPGNFLHSAGIEAIRLLLDDRKVFMQAIVAANDDMALGALEALHTRGVHVPEVVAVVGFDDIENAKANTPSLTTVWQPLFGQAKKAAENLFSLWAGKIPPAKEILLTELVVRKSCGCLDPEVVHAAAGKIELADELIFSNPAAFAERVFASMVELPQAIGADPIKCKELYEAFAVELNNGSPGAFLLALDNLFRTNTREEISVYHDLISALRRFSLPFLHGESLSRAEDLWHQARVALGLATQQRQAHLRLQAVRQTDALQKITEVLAVTYDTDMLMNVLAERLPSLGIASCYLSLYENSLPNASGASAPEWCRLVMAYNETGRIKLESGGRRFPSRQLVPAGLLPQDEPLNFVLEPLYFQNNQLGFILFEATPHHGRIYEMLRAQLSSSLQSASLMQQVERHSLELESAYNTLQKQQQMLLVAEKMASLGRLTAGIAHEMNSPLAAVRSSLSNMDALAREYKESIGDSTVTPEDHQDIAQEMEQAISLATKAIERAASFVRSIKSQTRNLDSKEYVHFNAVSVIEEALLLLGHSLREKKCSAVFEHSEDTIDLYGSPLRLSQIVTNLVNNAIDASMSKQGGPIILKLIQHTNEVELQVSDHGSGIAPEILPKIYDPMFTTKPFGQSTGLGLTIVHDIVVGEFGGSINISSQVNQGTTFLIHFSLPPQKKATP